MGRCLLSRVLTPPPALNLAQHWEQAYAATPRGLLQCNLPERAPPLSELPDESHLFQHRTPSRLFFHARSVSFSFLSGEQLHQRTRKSLRSEMLEEPPCSKSQSKNTKRDTH